MSDKPSSTASKTAFIIWWGFLLAAAYFGAEYYSKSLLRREGWLPPDGATLEERPFGRQVNGFMARQNTPNYSWNAYDDKYQLHKNALQTDENGFVTGGTKLTQPKDSNTVRIFLLGGSTAWGSLQTSSVMDSASYPEGIYTYDVNLPGQLKAILQQRHPEKKFEVINAAVMEFSFAQNRALYDYKIHNYKPDIVINLDANNDEAVFTSPFANGDPYMPGQKQFEEELALNSVASSIHKPYTFMLLNVRYQQRRERKKASANMVPWNLPNTTGKPNIAGDLDSNAYKIIEPTLAQNAGKYLWLVNAYMQQLKSDGVYSIYCMQPLLSRRRGQKQLSAPELKMRAHLEKVTDADTAHWRPFVKRVQDSAAAYYAVPFNEMGLHKYQMRSYYKGYFCGEYLSPKIDSLAKVNGQGFIDVCAQMNNMGADKEFYVDYCHLTPYGCRFVAELMAVEVEKYLGTRTSALSSPVISSK